MYQSIIAIIVFITIGTGGFTAAVAKSACTFLEGEISLVEPAAETINRPDLRKFWLETDNAEMMRWGDALHAWLDAARFGKAVCDRDMPERTKSNKDIPTEDVGRPVNAKL